MIKNERQYRITTSQAVKFERAIKETAKSINKEKNPGMRKLEIEAMKSQLNDLQRDLVEYEALRQGKRKSIALESLAELPKTLIQARIAAGMTHKQLAAKLGVNEQQIQRYEETNYSTANLEKIQEIYSALGVEFRRPIELQLAIVR